MIKTWKQHLDEFPDGQIITSGDEREAMLREIDDLRAAPRPIKDHEIAKAVNALRDVALEFHGSQQLRERIAQIVRGLVKS